MFSVYSLSLFSSLITISTPYWSHFVSASAKPRGGFLVLQLHDELIYEVSTKDVAAVARIVKRRMETTTPLSVRMPVKIKVGQSWGRLEDFDM